MSAAATEPAPLPEMVSFLLRSNAEGTAASAPARAPICTYLMSA
jgi:hypothetical protein